MADENAARFEQMEQTTQELKEMLLKNQEEHREQMANLMEMVLQLTKGKTMLLLLYLHGDFYIVFHLRVNFIACRT